MPKNQISECGTFKICTQGHKYFKTSKQCIICQKQRDHEYNKTEERKLSDKKKKMRRLYWPNLSSEAAWQERQKLFEKQQGRCMWCNRHQSEFNKDLAVDHCKVTGKIRGLLCLDCNHRIISNHTVESAEKLLAYLKK